MNPIDKIDAVLDNVAPDLSRFAPRKTNVHVEARDDAYVVLTEDDRYIGILNTEIMGNIHEYSIEIRSVRHSTPDQSLGQVMVRLRKKSPPSEKGKYLVDFNHSGYNKNVMIHHILYVELKLTDTEVFPQQQEEEQEFDLFSKHQLEMLGTSLNVSAQYYDMICFMALMQWPEKI